MKKQVVVIGLGRFGYELAKSLSKHECEVIGIDKDEEKVKAVSPYVDIAVALDALDIQALKDIGIKSVDIAVVSIGENIEANVLIVMQLKKLGVRHIIAKAASSLHKSLLDELGVSRVILPERDMAQRLAKTIVRPHIMDTVEVSAEFSLVEVAAPQIVCDKSIIDAHIRSQYNLSIIGIRRHMGNKEELFINPAPTTVIKRDDMLIVLGKNVDIDVFEKL